MKTKRYTDYLYDSDEFKNDPLNVIDKFRESGEVVWSPVMRRWVVTSDHIAKQALSTKGLIAVNPLAVFEKIATLTDDNFDSISRVVRWFPFIYEGRDHQRYRELFARTIMTVRARYLENIEYASTNFIQNLSETGGGDFAAEYADRLHVEALSSLLGFPQDARKYLSQILYFDGLAEYGARLSKILNAQERLVTALDIFREHKNEIDKSSLYLDVSRNMLRQNFEPTSENIYEFLIALMLEGRDTISGTLTVGLDSIIDYHQNQKPTRGIECTDTIHEEILRLTTATQYVVREAKYDINLGDQKILKGETVNIMLLAANHDIDKYKCPHSINLEHPSHKSFGAGKHACVAALLANDVISIALKHLGNLNSIRALPGAKLGSNSIIRKYRFRPIEIN